MEAIARDAALYRHRKDRTREPAPSEGGAAPPKDRAAPKTPTGRHWTFGTAQVVDT